MICYDLPDESATIDFAQKIAKFCTPPLILTLKGDLGAGKTTLVRALLRQLGITSTIKSPTFSLVESYQNKELQIHHFDLYRIEYEDELEDLGFRDYLQPDAICLIEWPERADKTIELADLCLELEVLGAGRRLCLSAKTAAGEKLLAELRGE